MKKIITFTLFLLLITTLKNHSQQYKWAKSFGGPGSDVAGSIAMDAKGHLYYSGSLNSSTVNSGPGGLTPGPGADFYLSKYDTAGNHIWSVRSQAQNSTSYATAGACTADKEGNIFLQFVVQGEIKLDTFTLNHNDVISYRLSTFLVKYNTQGKVMWVRKIAAPNTKTSGSVGFGNMRLDKDGNLIMCGTTFGNALIGNDSVYLPYTPGGQTAIIAKFNPDGEKLWVKIVGAAFSSISFNAITADDNLNIWVTGNMSGNPSFEGTIISADNGAIVTAKYNGSGDLLWVRQAGKKGKKNYVEAGTGIGTDDKGNAYVTCYYRDTAWFGTKKIDNSGDDDVALFKYTSLGDIAWARQIVSGGSHDKSSRLSVDSKANIYTTGYASGKSYINDTVDIGSDSLGASARNMFVGKFDSSGKFIWAAQSKTQYSATPIDVLADNYGYCYITGTFFQELTLGIIKLPAYGDNDAFLAKVGNTETITSVKKDNSIVQNNFLIYPNPSSGIVNFSYNIANQKYNTSKLTITDINGKIVREISLNSQEENIQITTTNLPSGVYICNLVTDQNIIKREKLILVK